MKSGQCGFMSVGKSDLELICKLGAWRLGPNDVEGVNTNGCGRAQVVAEDAHILATLDKSEIYYLSLVRESTETIEGVIGSVGIVEVVKVVAVDLPTSTFQFRLTSELADR